MAWRRPGDKPLSEPMMVSLPMHICVTRPQWVNQQALKRIGKPCVAQSRTFPENEVSTIAADALAPSIARSSTTIVLTPQDKLSLSLTHLPLDKMAANLADDIFKCIFLNEYNRIQIQISLNLVPGSPIDNKPALVQVMAWCWTGDKPLSEPMLTQFTDAFMWH